MSLKNDIEKRISEEQTKIATWREQANLAEAFIQGLQEALKLIPNESQKRLRRPSKQKGKLRSGSDTDKVYHLLRQTDSPMHIGDILIGIGKENTSVNRLNLSSTLSRFVRRNKIFARPAPNKFTLKEKTPIQTTKKPSETLSLPKEFGADEVKQKTTKQSDEIPF